MDTQSTIIDIIILNSYRIYAVSNNWNDALDVNSASGFRKDVTPINSILGGLMEQLNDCLQLGRSY